MGEEADCEHRWVYLPENNSGEHTKRGHCVDCDGLVDLTRGYAKHPKLRWEEDGQINPVFEKKDLDMYNILTRPGADIEVLVAHLSTYGNVLDDLQKSGILRIECTEEEGERLSADYKGKVKDSPLDAIMVLNKRKKEE
ncbi:hypothetical protein KY361_02805 [Candidatus Woesearchaeota archaeon]|nr:hypothetical protein [Candidatus Woesearchaeota archaeon]